MIEHQIRLLKFRSYEFNEDKITSTYHGVFIDKKRFQSYLEHSVGVLSESLWFMPDTTKKIKELDIKFISITNYIVKNPDKLLMDIGIMYYSEILELVSELETLAREDLLILFDIKKFKKSIS